jgi:hypothetical protein
MESAKQFAWKSDAVVKKAMEALLEEALK